MYPLQAQMDRTDIGTLLIPNVKTSDSGTYMCVGSNSIGSNSAPIKVTVLKGETAWYPNWSGGRFRGSNKTSDFTVWFGFRFFWG